MTVAGIVEIRPWILSWGDAVEVVGPPALREAVAGMVQRAADSLRGLRRSRSTEPSLLVVWRSSPRWGSAWRCWFYVGWDGALWDPRYQLGLHLAAVAVFGGLLWIGVERRRPAAHAAGDPDPGSAAGLRHRQRERLEPGPLGRRAGRNRRPSR